MTITETTLEMHFHRPLMELFISTFGAGSKGRMNFYKYSQQKECFVGFDQAYVRTELRANEFFELLKTASTSARYGSVLGDRFLGYFLQFKIVRAMHRRSQYTPVGMTSKPHYRVRLDTQKNQNTRHSQHELLYYLAKNRGAFVYYACPMLFDRDELYNVNVDLDALSLADVADAPGPYSDNSRHHLYFNEPGAQPIWMSEPHLGTAVSPQKIVEQFRRKLERSTAEESQHETLNLVREVIEGTELNGNALELSPVSGALTVIHWK